MRLSSFVGVGFVSVGGPTSISTRNVERQSLQIDLQIDIFQADGGGDVEPNGREVQDSFESRFKTFLGDLRGCFRRNRDDSDFDAVSGNERRQLRNVLN